MKKLTAVTALIVVLATACSKPDASPTGESAATSADSMANMPGMGATGATAMAQALETHLKAMKTVSADSLKTLLPSHRQMTANLIAAFNKEMRDMNMAADVAWTATVDSLRADLRTMPDLTGPELQARMPGHVLRLTRLMQMHQAMMRNMK